MKTKQIKIFLAIILILIAIISLILFTLDDKKEPAIKTYGMTCFNQCNNICKIQDSKVISFTAKDGICGCTCSNMNQSMIKLK